MASTTLVFANVPRARGFASTYIADHCWMFFKGADSNESLLVECYLMYK